MPYIKRFYQPCENTKWQTSQNLRYGEKRTLYLVSINDPEKGKVYLIWNNVSVLIGRGINYHVNICLASLKDISYLGMISQAIAKTNHFSPQTMIHLIIVLLEEMKMQKMKQQIQKLKAIRLDVGQMKKTFLQDLVKKMFSKKTLSTSC